MTTTHPTQEKSAESVSIATAAKRLGEAPGQVRDLVERGMLAAIAGDMPGEMLITQESLERLIDRRRSLAIIAEFPSADLAEVEDESSSTLLAQMLSLASDRDERS